MENTPCHFEIPADDLEAARDFYTGLFSWTIKEGAEGDGEYLMISPAGQTGALGGGLMKRAEGRQLTIYFTVESVDESARRVEELGGTILAPKVAIPRIGWAVTARDPQGNDIGLFEEDPEAA